MKSIGPRSALLIVDVQNDFCPGGALGVPAGDRVIPAVNRAIHLFQAASRPVYASRDWHPPDTSHFKARGGPWPPHCVAGTPGAAFRPDLRLPHGATVVSKGRERDDDGYSAFEGTTDGGRGLGEELRERGIAELYIGGLTTEYCVRSSVRDALNAGLRVTVLADAVAGLEEEASRRAIEEMRQAGASIVSTRDLTAVPEP